MLPTVAFNLWSSHFPSNVPPCLASPPSLNCCLTELESRAKTSKACLPLLSCLFLNSLFAQLLKTSDYFHSLTKLILAVSFMFLWKDMSQKHEVWSYLLCYFHWCPLKISL
jgi:hypothetical protein